MKGAYAVAHMVGCVCGGVVLWASWAWIAPSLLHAGEVFPTSDNPAVSSNNEFALDLYQHLAKGNAGANLFFSPYSLFSALLMVVEGARGETARQRWEEYCDSPRRHKIPGQLRKRPLGI
jgi:hypothetical protein